MPRGRIERGNINEGNEEAAPFRIRLNLKQKDTKELSRKDQNQENKLTADNQEENKENTVPTAKSPKITLSVRRLSESIELPQEARGGINHVEIPTVVRGKIGRPRGRPPKYPRDGPLTSRMASFSRTGLSPSLDSRLASLSPSYRNSPTSIGHPQISTPLTHTSSISLREQERFKQLQNLLPQYLSSEYEKLFKVEYQRPFASKQDAYERLLPFHVLSRAACPLPLAVPLPTEGIASAIQAICRRYSEFSRSEREMKVPIEIQLLENRLNLEEERFLLQKLKNECISKYEKIPLL